MKIQTALIMSAFMLITIPMSAQALDIGNSGGTTAGAKIDVDPTVNTTDPPFVFQPSTNVWVAASSVASSYSVVTWHDSAVDAAGGEGYGMASDVTGVFTFNMAPTDDDADPGAGTAPVYPGTPASDSSDLAGTGWEAPVGTSSGT